ncbi:MAG: cell division protein FtsL [Myxococcota bacterium]
MRSTGLWVVFVELLPAALLCGLFAAVGVVHVTSRALVVRSGYELSRLEGERRVLLRDHDRLQLELATLKSPSRLEKLAREKLGMGPPAAGAVIPLDAPKGRTVLARKEAP